MAAALSPLVQPAFMEEVERGRTLLETATRIASAEETNTVPRGRGAEGVDGRQDEE